MTYMITGMRFHPWRNEQEHHGADVDVGRDALAVQLNLEMDNVHQEDRSIMAESTNGAFPASESM